MRFDGKIALAGAAATVGGAYLYVAWTKKRENEERLLQAYGVPEGVTAKDVKSMSDAEIDKLADKAVQKKLETMFG